VALVIGYLAAILTIVLIILRALPGRLFDSDRRTTALQGRLGSS
jgi:hypothetical protein